MEAGLAVAVGAVQVIVGAGKEYLVNGLWLQDPFLDEIGDHVAVTWRRRLRCCRWLCRRGHCCRNCWQCRW